MEIRKCSGQSQGHGHGHGQGRGQRCRCPFRSGSIDYRSLPLSHCRCSCTSLLLDKCNKRLVYVLWQSATRVADLLNVAMWQHFYIRHSLSLLPPAVNSGDTRGTLTTHNLATPPFIPSYILCRLANSINGVLSLGNYVY